MEDEILQLIRREAELITERHGLEVFDLTFRRESRGWVLRLTIDNPVGYVSIRDCELVSRELERWLDEEDPIKHRYYLEVSSPGLNRPLRNGRDYTRFIGERAKVVLKDGRVIKGRIEGYENGRVKIEEDGRTEEFDIEDVKRANLEPEF